MTALCLAFSHALTQAEIVSTIEVPCRSAETKFGDYRFCRKPGEFADASCAVYIDPTRNIARVVLGGLEGAPRSISGLATQIASQGVSVITDETISAAVAAEMPNGDAAEWLLHAAVVKRCFERLQGA